MAVTFDDLPAHGGLPPGQTRVQIAHDILAALKAARVRSATALVNGVQVEREPGSEAALDLWRKADHPLGSHTWSHPHLDMVGPDAFMADIARNEPGLAARMAGRDWKWFRYPFMAEGATPETRAQVRRYLAERGYHIASVTLSFDDWAFNDPYARCMTRGDMAAVAELERQYMDWARLSLARSRGLARTLYGRDIPYVLVLHAGAFDARMLPRLLAWYRSEGFRFASLETVERHPFYRDDYDARPSDKPLSLEAEADRRGHVVPPRPWNPGSLNGVCR
ncbi:MAG: polysaccharide deacetylase family protein [Alphaproteobacteria bacterium]|nr:polysaccharide deacetylase family protein [Alphaproteobacteria bacterium]MBU1515285.1 polysaccharide deacetylase family protein [Alphaproteobacteria bacterium]MBU2092415.1 polysaccharide deacetylase family protein [Alphaproteobacteria bacterium]MBU2153009.1 polysaccharide deacetylase family protein [Alphaproteobacteria bacterium]MBU2305840.1 polysaccharide deacetylase family protein [Alphaproteobacteria bacterium]